MVEVEATKLIVKEGAVIWEVLLYVYCLYWLMIKETVMGLHMAE